jgi:hypothetical protein
VNNRRQRNDTEPADDLKNKIHDGDHDMFFLSFVERKENQSSMRQLTGYAFWKRRKFKRPMKNLPRNDEKGTSDETTKK